jgi:hypothetical protein
VSRVGEDVRDAHLITVPSNVWGSGGIAPRMLNLGRGERNRAD